MHSADSTIGRSVRKTPRGHEGANTLNFGWGICWNFGMQTSLSRSQTVRAESGDAIRGRRRRYRPPVTATGEGRP
jgi:hypothetical protein